jgi:hypothetical protein
MILLKNKRPGAVYTDMGRHLTVAEIMSKIPDTGEVEE